MMNCVKIVVTAKDGKSNGRATVEVDGSEISIQKTEEGS